MFAVCRATGSRRPREQCAPRWEMSRPAGQCRGGSQARWWFGDPFRGIIPASQPGSLGIKPANNPEGRRAITQYMI